MKFVEITQKLRNYFEEKHHSPQMTDHFAPHRESSIFDHTTPLSYRSFTRRILALNGALNSGWISTSLVFLA
jgi:hypothetical protein